MTPEAKLAKVVINSWDEETIRTYAESTLSGSYKELPVLFEKVQNDYAHLLIPDEPTEYINWIKSLSERIGAQIQIELNSSYSHSFWVFETHQTRQFETAQELLDYVNSQTG